MYKRCLILLTLFFLAIGSARASDSTKRKTIDSTEYSRLNVLAIKYKADPSKFIRYSLKALNVAKEMKYEDGVNQQYNEILHFYHVRNGQSEAIGHSLDFLEYSKANNFDLTGSYYSLGLLYSDIGNKDKALYFVKKAFDIAKKNWNENTNACGITYGLLLSDVEKYEEAIACLTLVQLRTNEIEYKRLIDLHLCRIYQKTNRQDLAQKIISNEYFQGGISNELQVAYYMRLAKYYIDIDKPSEGIEVLKSGLQLSEKMQARKYENTFLNNLIHAYISVENVSQIARIKQQQDSIAHLMRLDNFENAFFLHQLNIELQKENFNRREKQLTTELKNSKLSARIQLFVVIALSTVLLGLIVVFRVYSRSNRLTIKNKEYEIENMKASRQNADLKLKLSQKILGFNEINNQILSIKKGLIDAVESDNLNDVRKYIKKLQPEHRKKFLEEFELQFSELHSEFYSRFLSAYPNLTRNEKSLVIFIKLNLSSKDISNITGRSEHSIEVARFRLRKKLDLTNSSISLNEFVTQFEFNPEVET